MVKTSRTLLLTSAAVVALSVTPHTAMAGPEGGVVVGGSANISQSGTKTDIHQHSNKAILDWRSFDITAQEHVEFHQPSSNAMALNRIRDTKPSQIDGKLTANGHVMLINPNGVVFGSSSQVDVGSLTATTADIDNSDFMAGRLDFNKASKLDAAIINEGSITVKEAGLLNLVAPRVENHGIIEARLGKVQLAAADTFTLDMAGDGLLQLAVTDEQAAKLTRNTGHITAEGGTIALTASRARSIVDSLVDNAGIVEAHSMTKVGGKVILGGSHTKVSGSINVNGKTGGGDVLIGGDYQGKATENVTTAKVTEVTNAAVITANATDQGDGGKVIVWADGATRFEGAIEAKGGINGGDGGFAEVSGKKYLEYAGDVDLGGDNLGTLLLDPDDLDIVAGAGNPAEFADDLIAFAENGGGTSTLGANTLSGRLSANANVILQANNTIDVNADVTSTGSGDLTLQTGTGGTITINNDIDVNTGDLTLQADNMAINAALTTNNTLSILASSVGRTYGLGSGFGGLSINDTELGQLSAANYIFGSAANGTITINTAHDFGDSNVTFRSGADIDLAGTLTKNTGADTVDYIFEADGNIINSNNADVVRNSGSINLTLNSDKDEDQDGAIALSNFAFDSNNGDFIAGGGLNPLTTAAHGGQDGVYDVGVNFSNVDISTGTGNISIRGEGEDTNAGNTGVSFFGGTSLISASGDITIHGKAGNGTNTNIGFNSNALIRSNDGTISLTGIASGSSVNNFGIRLPGGNIQITGNGDIILDGTGGNGTSNNYGIFLQAAAAITSTGTGVNAGTITLNGTGGDGTDDNYGIYLLGDATQITSVDGNILLRGVGGSVSGFNNHGIYFHDGADVISSGTTTNAATITLDGDASRGSGALINGGTIQSGYGDILINGDSSTGGQGVMISNFSTTATQSRIISNGDDDIGNAANITINGNSNSSNGVFLHVNAGIETEDGDVNINANGNQSLGALALRFGSYIRSFGTGNNAGTITLSGTSTNSVGLGVNASSYIRSIDGNIDITGQGGNSASGDGIGVQIGDHDGTTYGYILSEGAADITINATAGDCTGGNCYGFYMDDATGTENYIRTTSTGNIDITGRGGNVGSNNYGIFLEGGAYIESTMTGASAGTITLNGTGGDGDDNNHGVYLTGSGTSVTSTTSAIDITGHAGNGVNFNRGVYIETFAEISSTSGSIGIDGYGITTGGVNNGINLFTGRVINDSGSIILNAQDSSANSSALNTNGSAVISTNSGDITFTGTSTAGIGNDIINGPRSTSGTIRLTGTSDSNVGLRLNNADVVSDGSSGIILQGISMSNTDVVITNNAKVGEDTAGSLASGDITIIADDWDFDEATSRIETLGNVIFQNRTSGTIIGLGGGAGALNLTDTELAQFNVGGDLTIGSSTAGAVHIDSVDFTGITSNNVSLLGGEFIIDGAVDAANSISMIATGDMTLNGSVSATGGGNSVVLVSDGFTNNGGAAAIDAGAGRYLVYANGPSTTTKGGLSAPHYYNRSYSVNAPTTITETGDLFLYSYQPTLSFNADDITLNTFNPNFNSFTYTVSGLEAGDSLPSVYGGNPAFVKSQQSPGIYRINGGLGSLVSLIGYEFAFIPGTLTMLSPAQQIPSTVEYQIQTPDSFFAGNNSFTVSYADNDFVSTLCNNGQAFAAIFINDGQHPEGLSILCAIMNKVIRPDVIRP